MSWADRTLVAFDLETTGPDPETARIVTAAIVTVDVTTGKVDLDTHIADPGIEIPAEATEVHGITTEYARTYGAPAAEVVRLLSAALADHAEMGNPVCIYNAAYDLTVLDRECRRYDVPTLSDRCDDDRLDLYVVDPLVLDRATERYRKGNRKLFTVCARYGIKFGTDEAHEAANDALATARLAWKIAHTYGESVGAVSLAELQVKQADWHRAWADEFEPWLRKQKARDGATADEIAAVRISRDWPIRPLPAAVTR